MKRIKHIMDLLEKRYADTNDVISIKVDSSNGEPAFITVETIHYVTLFRYDDEPGYLRQLSQHETHR